MKNVTRLIIAMLLMVAMSSCEDYGVPKPDFSNYQTWLVGEWVLVDDTGITEATDSTMTVYNDDGEAVSYVVKTLYAFTDGVTGSRELTTYTVATEQTSVDIEAFEYHQDAYNGLTISWDDVDEDPLDTKIHFADADVLFTDFLHNDVRDWQTHLIRYR